MELLFKWLPLIAAIVFLVLFGMWLRNRNRWKTILAKINAPAAPALPQPAPLPVKEPDPPAPQRMLTRDLIEMEAEEAYDRAKRLKALQDRKAGIDAFREKLVDALPDEKNG